MVATLSLRVSCTGMSKVGIFDVVEIGFAYCA
jgi:hypothetical protein